MADTGSIHILSLEECQTIVQNALTTKELMDIESYAVVPGSSDLVGFMGEYFKLTIKLGSKSPVKGSEVLQFFVKSVPISNAYHRDECERKHFFFKETSIYRDILPHIQHYATSKLFCSCYYVRSDLFVLEDLSTSLEGFRHLHASETYNMKHHRLFLKHLAKLHSASLAWEAKENVDIGRQFKNVLFEMQLTMNNEWYVTGMKGIIYLAQIHPKFQTDSAQNFVNTKLPNILSRVEELTAPSSKLCNVLCHRDSWDRNIFFQFNDQGDPIDCRIVDFQLTRYSPPAIDVLFYLYSNNSTKDRQNIYSECINYYYDALMGCLEEQNLSKDLISRKDFDEDCVRSRLAALILSSICVPLMRMPEGLSNKWRSEESEKFNAYMNSDRSEMFSRIMAMSKKYEQDIMEPIEELMEYLLNNENIF